MSPIKDLEGTCVDAVCMCVGDSMENYFGDGSDIAALYEDVEAWVGQPGPAGEAVVESIRQGYDNLCSLAQRGLDHFRMSVEQVHRQSMRCFASIRMNDTHEDDELRIWFGRSRFKRENPDLLIGGPLFTRNKSYHTNYTWAFNYAMPRVRELFLDIVARACENYDIDGIEFDFGKSPRVFKEDEAYRSAPILNDFLRQARELIDSWSKKKGKPMILMARSLGTTAGALREGFDHATWIKEQLIDILVPMSCSYLSSENDVAAHVELARGTKVLIYGGLELNVYKHSPCSRIEMLRSVAANALHDGAAGTYVFNYDCHCDRRGPDDGFTHDEFGALCELHDLEALSRRDRLYFVTPDPGWVPDGDLARQLPRMIGGTGRFSDERQSCTLRIGDDLEAARREGRVRSFELRVLLDSAVSCADRLFCVINDQRFKYTAFDKLDEAIPAEGRYGSLDADFRALHDPPLLQGDNRIAFLLDGIEAPEPWPQWILCEVAVRGEG